MHEGCSDTCMDLVYKEADLTSGSSTWDMTKCSGSSRSSRSCNEPSSMRHPSSRTPDHARLLDLPCNTRRLALLTMNILRATAGEIVKVSQPCAERKATSDMSRIDATIRRMSVPADLTISCIWMTVSVPCTASGRTPHQILYCRYRYADHCLHLQLSVI